MGVDGREVFREKFAGYEDSYTVIGGFACEILLGKAQRSFEDAMERLRKLYWR